MNEKDTQHPDAGKPPVTRDALNTNQPNVPPKVRPATAEETARLPHPYNPLPPSERGVFGADAPDPKEDLVRLDAGLHRVAGVRARLRAILALAVAPAAVGDTAGSPARSGLASTAYAAQAVEEEVRDLEALLTALEAAIVLEVRHSGHAGDVRYAALGLGLPSPLLSFGPLARLKSRVPAELVMTKQQLADW